MAETSFFGPTYEEMLYPERIEASLRTRAIQAAGKNEGDPANLFNITWKDRFNRVRKIVLPRSLTGVDANIVVMLGCGFPSGSHKVGPAYATLMEGCLDGEIRPGEHTILGPSTGNFGIGVAYICSLLGFRSVIIMPDNMSRERYERIRTYGGELDLTPGLEGGVGRTLKRTCELKKNPGNKALAQFELMPNYRFHRYVTGYSAVEAVKGLGNGRIACFVAAPGSGGTMGAGDHIRQVFPEARIAALEPHECPTLAEGWSGQHHIEGIGDKMCNLIHNVLTTDYIALVHDDHCIRALKIMQDGKEVLKGKGLQDDEAEELKDIFGISGMCNIIGSIKMAAYLGLGPGENVVTVATDGFDRYGSTLEALNSRYPLIYNSILEEWFDEIFHDHGKDAVYDCRSIDVKEKLFLRKRRDWIPFGYSEDYLDSMREQVFWEKEYQKVKEYDEKARANRIRYNENNN